MYQQSIRINNKRTQHQPVRPTVTTDIFLKVKCMFLYGGVLVNRPVRTTAMVVEECEYFRWIPHDLWGAVPVGASERLLLQTTGAEIFGICQFSFDYSIETMGVEVLIYLAQNYAGLYTIRHPNILPENNMICLRISPKHLIKPVKH